MPGFKLPKAYGSRNWTEESIQISVGQWPNGYLGVVAKDGGG